MEKKPPLVMTPFDESLTNDFLQLVKIILPYLPDHVQRIAGIYVKLTEKESNISLFSGER